MRKRPAYALNSVDNALLLIHALRDQGSMTVTEVAELLRIAPSSAHRLLATLVYRDFAVQDERHIYHPGPALGLLAGTGRPLVALRRHLLPHLEQLRQRVGETANIAVRIGTSVRFVASAESTQPLRVADQEGTVLPAHVTSGGKALLATLPVAELHRLYRPDAPASQRPFGVSDQEWRRLTRGLAYVRTRGYAVNNGAAEPGVSALGVAITDHTGTAVAAMSIAMPSSRFRAAQVPALVTALREVGAQASADLAAAFRQPNVNE